MRFTLHALGFITALLLACPLQGATRVELVIDEPRAERNVPWPITTGVPFPRGALKDATQCRLIDERGVEQPLQTKVAATWDAERSSIRWLTIDFIAEPRRKYALEFGTEIRRMVPTLPIQASATAVSTGPLKVEFDRTGPAALRSVRIDLNRDGQFTPSEQVAGADSQGDHQFLDQLQQSHNSTRDAADRQITVESSGPIRACVRVDGYYTGPRGERLVHYRTRYHFFAGLSLIKAVDEFRVVGSTRDTQFADIALPIALSPAQGARRVVLDSADAHKTQEWPWRDATTSFSSAQETYRHFGNPECRGQIVEQSAQGEQVHATQERVGAWLQVVDDRAAITGSLRWFWQQFPKQWELTRDKLVLHLWSPRAGALDFGERGLRQFFGPAGNKYLLNWEGTRTPQTPIENFFYFAGRRALERGAADGLGINKHHEVWWHFAPATDAQLGVEYGRLADQPPLALATGEWNCSTDVFGPLASRPNSSPYEAIVDRIFSLERYAQDTFGDYGWWLFGSGPHYSYQWDKTTQSHYADPRRFEYHTYQRETQLWWCYLRSGERKFYDWAIPSENHWVDIAVSHMPTRFDTEWRGGRAESATLHWPRGDWSIDSPLHYVRHHDTGEAWLRGASQYWASYHRTLETTSLAYYLTDDERYNDVIDYWRQYWGPLAGKRADATDIPVWHQEQNWFRWANDEQRRSRSWAQLLRDYAPFQSGSRHQQTLFFNLATLYEHTWDPTVKQVLSDYAEAFLDPAHRIGVWRCQDNSLPKTSDSPMLAHYWSPALWKYARATNDSRMPDILRRYFMAGYWADPYGGDVGVYSNNQIAWAWHFTRDPRHLIAAQRELDNLLPNAEPLSKPEDLGQRIYNPYAPIKSLAATPRLIAALQQGQQAPGTLPAPPPLAPQRTTIAIHKREGAALHAELWGWDPIPELSSPTGQVTVCSSGPTYKSHRQPFDRLLANFEVYSRQFEVAAPEPAGWYTLRPKLETGLLSLTKDAALLVWGAEPIYSPPRQRWTWRVASGVEQLLIESAKSDSFSVTVGGMLLPKKIEKQRLVVSLTDVPQGSLLTIENTAKVDTWFRLAELAPVDAWLSPTAAWPNTLPTFTPEPIHKPFVNREPAQPYVAGRFGQALLITDGRELRIPDEIDDGQAGQRRLSDLRQGTIEFWIRRLWDDRLTPHNPFLLVNNNQIMASLPARLPLDDWAHVAIVWRSDKSDPTKTRSHLYVNGRDTGEYRSVNWAGYAQPFNAVSATREWLKYFTVRAPLGASFALDDVRCSSKPRYYDKNVEFGGQQTFNPFRFLPSDKPAEVDADTLWLLSLDGQTQAITGDGKILAGQLIEPKQK